MFFKRELPALIVDLWFVCVIVLFGGYFVVLFCCHCFCFVIDRVVIDRCDPLRVVDRFGMVFFVDVTPGVAGECFLHDV